MADAEKIEDIKAVDMMNYPSECGYGQYLFKYEEFKIMARTTFKSIWGVRFLPRKTSRRPAS
jgi:hypothetical protein